MAAGWQEVAAQQAEEVSARVRQLVSTGLGLLRTELGVDLGLQPQRYPAWVFLALPLILGLFLLFLCASALGRSSAGKKRVREQRDEPLQLENPVPVPKSVKDEDPRKKNKKKPAEKPKQPNGRPVELVDDAITTIDKKENQKQSSEAEKKNEKTKKNKKKPKTDPKHPQQSANHDKKEVEEGNWETKISNREKRQRKRDKGTDSDLNINIVETISSVVSEQFSSGPSHSAGTRKSKGTSDNNVINGSGWSKKPSKIISTQLAEEKWAPSTSTGKKKTEPSTWNQNANDANGKDWGVSWGERPIFPGMSAWSNVDGRMTVTEQRQTSFTAMGLNNSIPASVTEPISQPATSESQWDSAPNEPCIDDEWSGPNGLNSSDPTSDWNAPAEEWGNCGVEEPVNVPQAEEPEQLTKVSEEEKEESSVQVAASGKTKKKKKKKKQGEESGSAQVSEEEKEESSAQVAASGKTKKKKKKKKQGEESGSAQDTETLDGEATVEFHADKTPAPLQPARISPAVFVKASEPKKQPEEETHQHNVVTEPSVSVKHIVSEKSPSLVQPPQEKSSSNSKQNSVPPPSQAKSEENWESPKQVKKKKKARRET